MINKKVENASIKPLTPAMEDYLEAIFALGKEKRIVRVRDIAKRLGVKMPTVTNMLKTLNNNRLIDYEKYEYLELTVKGFEAGKEIERRHHALRSFLTDILKINIEKADEEACKMEHAISASTMDRFIEFMEFVQNCPRAGSNWLEYFNEYRLHGQNPGTCLDRMKGFVDGFRGKVVTMEKMEVENNGSQ